MNTSTFQINYSLTFIIVTCLDILDISKKVPTKHELLDLLADIDDKWHEVGLAFHVPDNILNGLKCNNDSNKVKLSKVIGAWITTNEACSVTWDNVISAIGGSIVNNKKKVDEICDYLAKGK